MEHNEIKEILQDILAGHIARIESKFDIIDYKLDSIEKQTTKTNGRVNIIDNEIVNLKFKNETHAITCPHKPIIEKLKEESITNSAVKKFILASIAITATVVGIIVSLIKLI